jgi:uncharacterized iron-regulated membrane protein
MLGIERPVDEGELRDERGPCMKLRTIVFWLHLLAGVVAGTIILVMSVTGVLLAFERQLVAFAERQTRTVQLPTAGTPRLALDTLVAKAHEAVPGGTPSGVILSADPMAAAVVNFGREQAVFVNPYTGTVSGHGAATLRAFFRVVTDWHRWLGVPEEDREVGRAITGACNAAFAVLVISGFYLWWPRRWTRLAVKAVTVPSLKLRGKPRDWNWHNAIGVWSAPVLLFITLTGMVISYQWAGNLIYALTGSEPPPTPQRPVTGPPSQMGVGRGGAGPGASGSAPEGRPGRQPSGEGSSRASLDALFASAARQAPHWRLINMRLPQRGAAQMAVMIEEADALHPYPRSTLTLDTATAMVMRWEPYASYNLGRTVRFWVRPVHTGEAGGLIGQLIAALASAGGAVLVYTGLALAWRRSWHCTKRRRRTGQPGREDTVPQEGTCEGPGPVAAKPL